MPGIDFYQNKAKQKSCVDSNMSGKRWVGRSGFIYLFIYLQPEQLNCTYWLSLCFTSINFVCMKEKNCRLLVQSLYFLAL